MQGMSERGYAARVRLSRGAIQKAKAAGRLVLHADGSIDPAGLRCPARGRDRPVEAAGLAGTRASIAEAEAGAERGARRRGRHAARERAPPPSAGGATFLQAKTSNEVLKSQERRLKLQKLKGELVDRARAEVLVFRLARETRDAWVNWPARAAALIAADLGLMQRNGRPRSRARAGGHAEGPGSPCPRPPRRARRGPARSRMTRRSSASTAPTALLRAWGGGLKPDPLLTVSEWADRYRTLSSRAAAEPGRYRTKRTPYMREIMDALSPAIRRSASCS